MTRLERQILTVDTMIGDYCRQLHHTVDGNLCPQCEALRAYAHERLRHCPDGNRKPSCRHCKRHCYSQANRVLIKQVMRRQGPRMLLSHPIMALRHLFIN